MIFAIDPGNTESAYVLYDEDTHSVIERAKIPNDHMLDVLGIHRNQYRLTYAIEMIASYGMPVGKDVFETCLWIGRFVQVIESGGATHNLVYRKDVKMHLCNSTKAKDGNIRQAIIDQFPAVGGGKTPQVGTKSQPGPLFGMAADMWAALGVALTYANELEKARAA